MNKSNLSVIVGIVAVLFVGCVSYPTEYEDDNPRDNEGVNYTPPKITSISITDGQRVQSRDITITWLGNSVVEEYRYSIDGTVSSWLTTTSISLTDLTEGNHIFSIEARNDLDASPVDSITFIIDAIQGPGIVFSPRTINSFTNVSIYLENVNEIMAAHIEIVCNDGCALINTFTKDESIMINGEYILFIDKSVPNRFILDILVVGEANGLTGTLEIGNLQINPLDDGEITIDADNTIFRSVRNENMQIVGLDMVRVVK